MSASHVYVSTLLTYLKGQTYWEFVILCQLINSSVMLLFSLDLFPISFWWFLQEIWKVCRHAWAFWRFLKCGITDYIWFQLVVRTAIPVPPKGNVMLEDAKLDLSTIHPQNSAMEVSTMFSKLLLIFRKILCDIREFAVIMFCHTTCINCGYHLHHW